MFGLLRTTLALMVMIFHIALPTFPLGTYPVFGFYIISGYLMTLIMHDGYGYNRQGRVAFALNRWLRLYPQYWASIVLTLVLIQTVGAESVSNYHPGMFWPQTFQQAASNLAMMFVAWRPDQVVPRLSPATWALTVEIFFYALICLGTSRTMRRVKVWLFLSVAYVAFSFAVGWPWQDRYFPIAAASLPFSIGSLIYFLAKDGRIIRMVMSTETLFLLMLANCACWSIIEADSPSSWYEVGFYLNLAICSVLVYGLARSGTALYTTPHRDQLIGDYSYPIYLLHWQGAIIAAALLSAWDSSSRYWGGALMVVVSIAIVLILSWVCIQFIDRPVQRVRAQIKRESSISRLANADGVILGNGRG